MMTPESAVKKRRIDNLDISGSLRSKEDESEGKFNQLYV